MELSLAMGKYAPIRRDSQNYVTHLLFTDGYVNLLKMKQGINSGDQEHSGKIKNYTGLSVNPSKSTIFFSKGAPTEKN